MPPPIDPPQVVEAQFNSAANFRSLIDSDQFHIGLVLGDWDGVDLLDRSTTLLGSEECAPLTIYEKRFVLVHRTFVDIFATKYPWALVIDPDHRQDVPHGRLDKHERPLRAGLPNSLQLFRRLGWLIAYLGETPELPAHDLVRDSRSPGSETPFPVSPIIGCTPSMVFDDGCPAGAPYNTLANLPGAIAGGAHASVVVVDTGLAPAPTVPGRAANIVMLDDDDDVTAAPGPFDPADNLRILRRFAGHGSFIAEIIAQRAAQAEIIVTNATYADIDVYVFTELEICHDICAGIAAATRPNVIVNLSLTGFESATGAQPATGQLFRAMITEWMSGNLASIPQAFNRTNNLVFVAAAGNRPGQNANSCFPATCADVVSVASISSADPMQFAWFSVTSGKIDFVASGEDVRARYVIGRHPTSGGYTDFPDPPGYPDPFAKWSGTSFSVAIVSAAIAKGTDQGADALTALNTLKGQNWHPIGPTGVTYPVVI